MKIRITGGSLRGRVIDSPEVAGTHPMGSREKMALFNMLVNLRGDLQGPRVLDAYAGSGALGIEALSRGAAEVVLVEKNRQAARVIQQNLANLGLTGVGKVAEQPVREFLAILEGKKPDFMLKNTQKPDFGTKTAQNPHKNDFCAKNRDFGAKFDLILADPPYDNFNLTEVAKLAQILAPGGILALSHPSEVTPEDIARLANRAAAPANGEVTPEIAGLELLKTRHYARANISIFTREKPI